jgi:hypothetical protein
MKSLLGLLLYPAILLLHVCLPGAAPAWRAPPTEGEIREHIYKVMRTDPKFHGSWVEVRAAKSGQALEFVLTVDRDARLGASQQEEIGRLLRSLLPPGSYEIVAVNKKPLRRLLADLAETIDENLDLEGCQIRGAYYDEVQGRLELMLLGRIADNSQRRTIVSACLGLMALDPASWREVVPQQAELSVVAPSESSAERFFMYGLEFFWQRRYAEAKRELSQAILESRGNVVYHYWRIVLEITTGDLERAYKHVRPWALRNRQGPLLPTYNRYLGESLERIQGPVRLKLEELELQALASLP